MVKKRRLKMKNIILKKVALIAVIVTATATSFAGEAKIRQEIDMQGNYITNLACPTKPDHAVPKGYADWVLDVSQSKLPKPGNGEGVCEGETGISWPNPRFKDNGDGTVSDNLTGLMWTQNGNLRGSGDWTNAINWCENLVTNGYSDWRLPNINELATLVNYSQANVALWLTSSTPFGAVIGGFYWSSSTCAPHNTISAWDVYFATGYVGHNAKTNSFFVWPVRAGR